MSEQTAWTPGPWRFERSESAVELARLKGETLAEHEGYFRSNNGGWIVTFSEVDEDGYQMGGPVCEVKFKGSAKRGTAYNAPDPVGMANARLIASAPGLYAALADCVLRLRRCAENGGNSPEAVNILCEQFEAALSRARGEIA